jgi:hypothetical protein
VTLLSGLPAPTKDLWLAANAVETKVILPDDLRAEFEIDLRAAAALRAGEAR